MVGDYVAIFDVDGVLTDGTFYQTKHSKFMKKFGPDDWDALKELKKHITVKFITADEKGFEIVKKRIVDDVHLNLVLVKNKPPSERWKYIRATYPKQKIIYVGDGIYDWYCLQMADIGFCPSDALDHVKKSADVVIDRKGGNRFVAEVCLQILSKLGVHTDTIGEENEDWKIV